jgi:tripartite-type tricarboxylate transporter receptor subunit TctC
MRLLLASSTGREAMKLSRRKFLHLAMGAIALPAALRIARAQTYPSRSARIVVGSPAGGGSDIIARLMGQRLSERLGQPFIVENRPGAGGNIAAEAVVRAPSDGYTLLMVGAFNAINTSLYEKLNFDFVRDIAPVSGLTRGPFVMLVNPSFPAKTVPEVIAYANANPGKVNMASAAVGTRVAAELFKMMTSIDLTPVPYRGGAPAITDLLGGQVQVYFSPLPEPIEQIRSGKLRALAVTTATRVDALPDIPTMDDFVPGYEVSGWQGIGAPKNTAAEIIDKLNKELNAALADYKMKARIADMGVMAFAGSPADFGKFIVADAAKWAKVVKFAGLKAD